MRRSQRWNNLQICPLRDSNPGGSDLWSNTLPLDHGGALMWGYVWCYVITCVICDAIMVMWWYVIIYLMLWDVILCDRMWWYNSQFIWFFTNSITKCVWVIRNKGKTIFRNYTWKVCIFIFKYIYISMYLYLTLWKLIVFFLNNICQCLLNELKL